MHDGVRVEFVDELQHALAVADVELVVGKRVEAFFQALLVPASVALRAEELAAKVGVDAVNVPAATGKVGANLRTDRDFLERLGAVLPYHLYHVSIPVVVR